MAWVNYTFKSKDMVPIPWMVAMALQADGWYLRSDIIWSKPNPMPESVTDRPTKAHEYIFLLSKSARYFFDQDAVREPHSRLWDESNGGNLGSADGTSYWQGAHQKESRGGTGPSLPHPDGRNVRSVWEIATQPYPEAHFATFPEAIPERCISAGSREGDLVLDPFCGSGTTGAVAVRLARDFVGIDLSADYLKLARKRIGSVAPLYVQEIA